MANRAKKDLHTYDMNDIIFTGNNNPWLNFLRKILIFEKQSNFR